MAEGTVGVEMVVKGKRKQKSWQKKRELLYLASFHKEGKYIVFWAGLTNKNWIISSLIYCRTWKLISKIYFRRPPKPDNFQDLIDQNLRRSGGSTNQGKNNNNVRNNGNGGGKRQQPRSISNGPKRKNNGSNGSRRKNNGSRKNQARYIVYQGQIFQLLENRLEIIQR